MKIDLNEGNEKWIIKKSTIQFLVCYFNINWDLFVIMNVLKVGEEEKNKYFYYKYFNRRIYTY